MRLGIAVGLLCVGTAIAIHYWSAPEQAFRGRAEVADVRDQASPGTRADGEPKSLSTESSAAHGTQSVDLPGKGVDSAGVFTKADQAPKPPAEKSGSYLGLPWMENVDPVGIPFPISDSVRRQCDSMKDLHANCDAHFGAFAQLATEARDKEWATATAKAIMALVASQDGYSIRALDCRTTVCGVEIEGRDAFDRPAARQLSPVLTRVDRVYGLERNSLDERVVVTSMTFRRR